MSKSTLTLTDHYLQGNFPLRHGAPTKCKTSIYVLIRYQKEIMKMERHFSALQRWLQKKIKNNNSQSDFDFT